MSVSAYPEKHPESPSLDFDIDILKRKVDAGASRAITQFFFDNEHYLRFVDRVRDAGIDVPIVPGIVPVQNFKQVKSFAERCGTEVPRRLAERFDGLDDDVATRKLVAAAVAAEQVFDLVDRGRHGFPLLHDEQGGPRLRDLPPARPAPARAEGGGVVRPPKSRGSRRGEA